MSESKKELHLSPQSISNISYSTPNSPALNPSKEFSTNSHASSSSAPISSILDTINFSEVDQISNLQNKWYTHYLIFIYFLTFCLYIV
jgi:hypothetical protein